MILLFESANFDETVFEDPERFNIDPLSEQPPRVRLRHPLLPRQSAGPAGDLDDAGATAQAAAGHALASDAALPLRPANFVSGLETMPVTFTPTKPLNI